MDNMNFVKNSSMMAYADSVSKFRLPRWEQIPTLGLYMDQVVTVIEKTLMPLIGINGEAIITPSMINNYVKLGMVQKPDKKKYSREHIASLIVITILKQATAIGDIRLGIDTVLKTGEKDVCYDSFCDYVERSIKIVAQSLLDSEQGGEETEIQFRYNVNHTMITMAVCSFATKIFTSKMLSIIREESANDKSDA